MVLFAFSLQAEVEKYGAYVGVAAFFGLAVLTILYFAQARELRRLRDWAGRAPERAQEVEARALANAEALRRQTEERTAAPAAVGAATPAAVGAATAAGAGAGGVTQVIEREDAPDSNGTVAAAEEADGTTNGAGPAAPADAEAAGEEAPAQEEAVQEDAPAQDEAEPAAEPAPAEVSDAAKAAGVGAAGGTLAARAAPGGTAAPAPSSAHAASAESPGASVPRATPVPRRTPAPAAPLRQPDRSATVPPRRPAPGTPRRGAAAAPAPASGGSHRITWIVVGIGALVLVAGALLLTGVIGGKDPNPAPVASSPTATATPVTSALSAASTNVAVLNGTTTAGIAATAKDKLAARGFTGKITTGNNTDQQRATSLVLYGTRPGAREQGRSISRILGIPAVQRLDADTRALGENADVVVILGQDASP